MADDMIKSKTSIYRFKMADDVVLKVQLQIQNGRQNIFCENHSFKKSRPIGVSFNILDSSFHKY